MKQFLLCAGLLIATTTAFGQAAAAPPPPPPFTMTAPALRDGHALPVKFSCSNAPSGVSPQLQWTNTPAGTQSFAILLHDPEPHPQKGIYDITHWFIYNIPGDAKELAENLPNGDLPNGAKQIKNIRGFAGYFGPCAPPTATQHHYTFELYALDTKLNLGAEATRADAMKAIDGHILGAAVYVTLFKRAQ
jgi:Raf kinase inhibitor-like YbhB/YbcL family protein